MNNIILVLPEPIMLCTTSVMLSTFIAIALHHTVHILAPMSEGLVEDCKLIPEYSHEGESGSTITIH